MKIEFSLKVTPFPRFPLQRWDRSKKKKVEVQCPSIVLMYNKFMGGVDLMDSLISLYRTSIRSKKWYLKIVFHLMDLVVVNAWLLYRRDCESCGMSKKEQMSLLQFKASVAACLCQQNKERQVKRGRQSSSSLEHQLEEKGQLHQSLTKKAR
jgi:hypothetical protein